ncbi:unnamed protein product [Ectocarpus sp. 13 AM-2016]
MSNAGKKVLFIAATRQHVGKTTVSLGLISGLKKRFKNVGFIKPVGQQHERTAGGVLVDKAREETLAAAFDVSLMKEFFGLKCRYEDMSPVLIPAGYTRDYIDGKITAGDQLKDVHTAFQNVMDESDVVVLEGTGHTAVGSVVDLNNAQVAKALNADMILVANGGLGSAYDELELNRGICEKYGIKVRGVVLNKVVPGKLQMVKEYFGKLLKSWDVPLLGVVPDESYLARPSLIDLEKIFKTKLLAGFENRRQPHYSIKHTHLAATDLHVFLEKLECAPSNPLVVTHCTRDDIVLGFLAHARNSKERGHSFGGAMVLTGLDLRPMDYVEELLKMHDIPVIVSNLSTFDTMDRIRRRE